MSTISRSRRAEIVRQAATVRMCSQRAGHSTERTAAETRRALPDVSPLEGRRLASDRSGGEPPSPRSAPSMILGST
ncbi:hypothetical protein [Streptomyces sp. NPDC054863]